MGKSIHLSVSDGWCLMMETESGTGSTCVSDTELVDILLIFSKCCSLQSGMSASKASGSDLLYFASTRPCFGPKPASMEQGDITEHPSVLGSPPVDIDTSIIGGMLIELRRDPLR